MTRNRKGQFSGTDITAEYKDQWQGFNEHLISTRDKERTVTRFSTDSKHFFNWCSTNDIEPQNAREDEITDYIRDHTHLSGNSLTSRYMAVYMLFDYWIDGTDGVGIEDNPCESVQIERYTNNGSSEYKKVLKRQGQSDLIAPTKEQVTSLFPYADEKGAKTELRNQVLIRLMWDTAVRCDELVRMKTENIDWTEQSIKIRSSKLKEHHDLYTRFVYFSDDTADLLRMWINGGREALSTKYADSDYIFITTHNPQMRPSHVSKLIKEAAHRHDRNEDTKIQYEMYEDASGNPRWLITGHRLRHARITYLANQTDMKITNLRMMAGHEKLETTMKYVHEDWESVKEDYHTSIS